MATEKQKQALVKSIENHGNVSKAMRDAGYTEATAKNPSNLTESKGWKELLEKNFPIDKLQLVLEEGLHADRPAGEQGTVPDYSVRHKYADTLLKLQDRYPAQKRAVDITSGGEKLTVTFDNSFNEDDSNTA